MADDDFQLFPNAESEGRPRRTTQDSLRMIQADAKESAVSLGEIEDLDEALGRVIFRMNGREAVLAFLLAEADKQITDLEMRVHLLLQTASCLIDDVKALREQLATPTEQKEN